MKMRSLLAALAACAVLSAGYVDTSMATQPKKKVKASTKKKAPAKKATKAKPAVKKGDSLAARVSKLEKMAKRGKDMKKHMKASPAMNEMKDKMKAMKEEHRAWMEKTTKAVEGLIAATGAKNIEAPKLPEKIDFKAMREDMMKKMKAEKEAAKKGKK